MSSGIEATDTMMYTKNLPWHGLGTYVGEEPILWAEAVRKAGLDWRVKKYPTLSQVAMPGGELRLVGPTNEDEAEFFNVVRARKVNEEVVLDLIGAGQKGRYQVFQNEDLGDFMNEVSGTRGPLRFHTAGSLKNGKKIWALAAFPGATEPFKGDRVMRYLLLSSTHDGSGAVHLRPTTVRVVCANTLSIALSGNKEGISFRHTGNLEEKIERAQEALGFIQAEVEAFDNFAKFLASMRLSTSDVKELVEELVPTPEKNPKRTEKVQARLLELVDGGKGTHIPGVRGSGWGFLNAVTEYASHERTYNDTTKQVGGSSAAENKFESLMFGNSSKLSRKAVDLLLAR